MYHVLVPVDRNADRAKHQLEYVTSMPWSSDDIEVTVLHVNPADYQGAKPQEFDDIEAAVTVRDGITEAGLACEGELRRGMVAKTILEAADDIGADEIVMAGRDRSGVMTALFGSVTHDVALSTERPVVVVG